MAPALSREQRTTLIDRYAAGYEQVTRALDGFPSGGLTAHPLPGKWSAAEIVHHLADSESISAQRLRKLVAEPNPVIWGYDQEVYATRLNYNGREMGPALEAFRAARATTLQILRAMTDADWEKRGWHTESGPYGPEEWLRIYAAHAHDHAAQITRLREALASSARV
jgi:DinB family protein